MQQEVQNYQGKQNQLNKQVNDLDRNLEKLMSLCEGL